ncbi:AAA family ATPase [Corallococcus sp. BB11-1]|uniref:AAA family ATPase n=1 Tax=Corallococcus sp. BB11-1 TaxID=2996783 RepID=UPI00226EC498|nr:AAA family ATPase [Corallococcus sp. BB11-1]MCY1030983.1 AAA family ATPase [Corallococcus sp. BB11-1]
MTRLDPSLKLSRLLVFKGGHAVYDERFHSGVNIIRGENSSGKSTLADMIFFALGGENILWKEEAASCDTVVAEVQLNGRPVTLSRSISSQKERPMRIFWGNYQEASGSAEVGWEQYPYAQRGAKQSFSQVLFRALGIPEVRGELASQVTMHQLLRLAYADQRTVVEEIFRHDDFDKKLVRDAVGALLCGYYDEKLYDAEFGLRDTKAELDHIQGQLSQLYQILGGDTAGLELFSVEIQERQKERNTLYEQLKTMRTKQVSPAQLTSDAERITAETSKNLRDTTARINALERQLADLDLELEDSSQFIQTLRDKAESLRDSLITRNSFGELSFDHCPSCHNPVAPPKEPNACSLCKAELTPGREHSQLLRLQQELSLQLKESQMLQDERTAMRSALAKQLPQLRAKHQEFQSKLGDLTDTASLQRDSALDETYRRIGYLDRELEDLQKRIQLAGTIRQLEDRKAELSFVISKLEDELKKRYAQRETRETHAKAEIGRFTGILLKQDLKREQHFQEVESVRFDFTGNRVEVNGRANYSASSMVIIKNSFHLALLLASTKNAFFRYPRFALFDNIEDKGMEEARSKNFQKIIIESSRALDIDHQIIFTTSMIAPEFNTPDLVVGDFYKRDHKSLRMPARI